MHSMNYIITVKPYRALFMMLSVYNKNDDLAFLKMFAWNE